MTINEIIPFALFILSIIFFLRKTLKLKAFVRLTEKTSGKKHTKWLNLLLLGAFAQAILIFLLILTIYKIYTSSVNSNLFAVNCAILPFIIGIFMFFIFFYFSMRIKNCGPAFENSTLNSAIEISSEYFFPSIKSSLKILSGHLNPDFLGIPKL